MSNIEVGEYIRTDNGIIIKYEFLEESENLEVFFGQKGKGFTFEDMEEFEDFIKQRIVAHSKNIIDLIEKGDYVNGEPVEEINIFPDEFIEIMTTTECLTNPEYIKSIVTKKQFKEMEYRIDE